MAYLPDGYVTKSWVVKQQKTRININIVCNIQFVFLPLNAAKSYTPGL